MAGTDLRRLVAERELTTNGYVFDTRPEAFGELRDSNDLVGDPAALRGRMSDDGYLLLRGYLDRDLVLAARRELAGKLDAVGLVDRSRPLVDAVYSGTNAGLAEIDRKAYAKDLRTGPALLEVLRRGRMIQLFEGFLGGAVRSLDYVWVRNVRVGSATGCHIDWVYMGRGTKNLYTAWTPMGDVPLTDGPLAILEGSHRLEELQRTYGALDVDRDKDHPYVGGWLSKDAPQVRNTYGGRWLTTEFEAGDILVFGMFLVHCSLDNRSPENRIRLSTDTRYQLASEPADERWTGEQPFGHGMD
jgi:phytanoyl-CoA dioxygenase PhyH